MQSLKEEIDQLKSQKAELEKVIQERDEKLTTHTQRVRACSDSRYSVPNFL